MEEKKSHQKLKVTRQRVADYGLSQGGGEDSIFIHKLEEAGRSTELHSLPPVTDVLAYVERLPERPIWFEAAKQRLGAGGLKFPNLDVLKRIYIRDFLRAPLKSEEPCENLTCESERLGGFRLRKLLLPMQKLNRWCFLCHLYFTNRLYLESLNRKVDPAKPIVQIQHFMVENDCIPGEYHPDMTLDLTQNVHGMYGPFPIYNCYNYTQTVFPNGCKGWLESDAMVFRPSQAMSSNPIESCCDKTTLAPSSPIGFPSPFIRSP